MAFFKKEEGKKVDSKLSKEQTQRKLADYVYSKFKEAMVTKAPYTKKWQDYIDAFSGDYFGKSAKPDYKSDQVSNFIYSTIETIRPIMTDNNPKFMALPRHPNGMDKSEKVQIAMDSEWDREKMSIKLPRGLVTTLTIGNVLYGLFWDGIVNDGEGDIKAYLINPLNFYPDPMATSMEDAEYVIYATYTHVNKLKISFPEISNSLEGGNIKYDELVASGSDTSKVTNQVLVLEMWCRDYTTIEVEEEKEKGVKEKKSVAKFPRGRVITVAPELNLVLRDVENPYKDGKFPFVLIKDVDVPFKFWGEGEVSQLISPQTYINELNNQVIDNAKLTANMPWIIDKNSGIGEGKLTNRPGLIIRKNPGSEVRRDAPPPMPSYVGDKINELKMDMETISGVHDVTQGKRAIGISAGNAIQALQEAGQARIRLKVRLLESSLAELASMWYSRMQQFWLFERWLRVIDTQGETNFHQMTPEDLENDFDMVVTAGSTMPLNKNAMLDLIIRLAQTTAEDGLPMVDRQTVLEFVPLTNKKQISERFKQLQMQQQAMAMGAVDPSMMGGQQPQPGSIPPEIIEMMNTLPDEELQELLQKYPQIQDIL